ncbi:MAG: YeeE/YedE family protein [Flavobacteriales bacterium]|nr:YeeE/YedE family protein [Flavobacteriales bacterium]
MNFIELIKQPWPWYVAGPLIGLMVPALLILGDKNFGISSSLRHICAACLPAKIPFFTYDWKKKYGICFCRGVLLGGVISAQFLANPNPVIVSPNLAKALQQYGITDFHSLVPTQLFNWPNLLTLKGITMMVGGGFLVGFGTRYAGGCTSGHAITGLSKLQWPSLVATICFMIGGFVMANLILPFILSL